MQESRVSKATLEALYEGAVELQILTFRAEPEERKRLSHILFRIGITLGELGFAGADLLPDDVARVTHSGLLRGIASARKGRRHTQDADCTVDPATGCCTGCGVDHSGTCPACGGHGFHADGCAYLYLDELTAAGRRAPISLRYADGERWEPRAAGKRTPPPESSVGEGVQGGNVAAYPAERSSTGGGHER